MDLSQEEINMVLEAGLEKVAYEEGLNDYAESLEKVAAVHNVDAVELHDFLEKEAEEESKTQKVKQWIKNNPGKVGAGLGAAGMGVASYNNAKKMYNNPQLKRQMSEIFPDASSDELSNLFSGSAKASAGLGAAVGAAGGALAGKGAEVIGKGVKNKEKTAAAYGLDGDTFDALFNAGVEALTK
jgi:hypothetical protein